MNTLKRSLAIMLALCMIIALAACGGAQNPEEKVSSEAETVTETEAISEGTIAAGTFSFTYVDEYGDKTEFTITTKDTGKAYVMYDGALGSKTLNADEWVDNGDGSITIGTLSEDLRLDFVAEDGKTTWVIDGEKASPKGYVEPTEFKEKENKAPASQEEAVGVYSFGFKNPYGKTSPYVFWVNSDGTWKMYQPNVFMGTAFSYAGEAWSYDPATQTLSLGPCTEYAEGEPPKTAGNGATWFSDDTYESSYILDGDGVAEIVGAEDGLAKVGSEDVPGSGIYTFGFKNPYGTVVPYIVLINEDGTWNMYNPNDFMKTVFAYSGDSWTYDEATKTLSLGPCTKYAEGEPPKTVGNGANWFTDDTFESSYIVNDDHTLVAIGAEDSMDKFTK